MAAGSPDVPSNSGFREDDIFGHAAVAVAEAHLGVAVAANVARAVDAARFDENVLGLAPVGAAVHAQRAADRARNAAQEREPRNAGLLRGLRDAQVRSRRAGAHAVALDLDLVEAAPEPDHHARHAAVAHDQVGAEANDGDGNLARQVRERMAKIALVLRHEQRLRRSADAKPGERSKRLVGEQAAAQVGERGFQGWHDVGEGHRHSFGSRAVWKQDTTVTSVSVTA